MIMGALYIGRSASLLERDRGESAMALAVTIQFVVVKTSVSCRPGSDVKMSVVPSSFTVIHRGVSCPDVQMSSRETVAYNSATPALFVRSR